MRSLKVYGWVGFRTRKEGHAGQTREIVAAKSMAEAARVAGIKPHYLRTYGCETGNPEELRVALADPGVVYWRPLDDYKGDYRRADS